MVFVNVFRVRLIWSWKTFRETQMSFQDFGLSDSIVRAVAAEGYEIPTPIQAAAIPHVLAGRDLLGCAQTGTGKTAAFALPILHRLSQVEAGRRGGPRRVRVLVLSPTRELASQIVQSFRVYGRRTGLRQTAVIGGVAKEVQIRAIRQGVDILVATPGRLVDLLNQGVVRLDAVETLVIDEADRMFDMGFLPDLRRIIQELPSERQTVFFSATMPPAIEQLADAVLRDPVRIKIEPAKETTDLIDQSVCFVSHSRKIDLLAKFLGDEGVTRAVVFTRTKHGADRVVRRLDEFGIASLAIHGNKSQAARERALAGFKSNRARVLVATDLASRGIDVSGVSHVFNYDLPEEPESYVHRIGRTGRAGATGIAVSFCAEDERRFLKGIERLLRRPIAENRAGSIDAGSDRNARPARRAEPTRFDNERIPRQGLATGSQPSGKAVKTADAGGSRSRRERDEQPFSRFRKKRRSFSYGGR